MHNQLAQFPTVESIIVGKTPNGNTWIALCQLHQYASTICEAM